MTDPRSRILARVGEALATRDRLAHPGPFEGRRRSAPPGDPVEEFVALFTSAGGEVVPLPSSAQVREWLEAFTAHHAGTCIGATVDSELAPPGSGVGPRSAALGVSMARAAVAETGSLVLDARDGRLTQLLPPTHVVVLRAEDVFATLREVLEDLTGDLPSALGLHSGPSKSADIGQILVKGVHGPGRLIVLLVAGAGTGPAPGS